MENRLKASKYRTAYCFVAFAFLCSQPLSCSIMRFFCVKEIYITMIQASGAILFSAFSVLFTKDFSIFTEWFFKHPHIKRFISFCLYVNLVIMMIIYMLLIKLPFIIGKSQEGCDSVDLCFKEFIQEFNEGSSILRAGVYATLFAVESAGITGLLYYCCSSKAAQVFVEVVTLLSAIANLIVLFFAIKSFVLADENTNSEQ